jgi:hypothetical protein
MRLQVRRYLVGFITFAPIMMGITPNAYAQFKTVCIANQPAVCYFVGASPHDFFFNHDTSPADAARLSCEPNGVRAYSELRRSQTRRDPIIHVQVQCDFPTLQRFYFCTGAGNCGTGGHVYRSYGCERQEQHHQIAAEICGGPDKVRNFVWQKELTVHGKRCGKERSYVDCSR